MPASSPTPTPAVERRAAAPTPGAHAAWLAGSLLGALALVACGPRDPEPTSSRGDTASAARVTELGLTVLDLSAATRWFVDELGATAESAVELGDVGALYGMPGARATATRLRMGDEVVVLTAFTPVATPGDRPPLRGNDGAFQHLALVTADLDATHAALADAGIDPISPAPQRIPDSNAAAAGIRAFYFRGPDGHPLELIAYPPDKGDPRWHAPADAPVIGIDHTAITVGDTERSLAFWRDLVGLGVAGGSLNEGIEQERLSGVPGARVRITGLRGPAGPGVELLHYLAPGPGEAEPARAANDPAFASTSVWVDDLDIAADRLRGAGMMIVSTAIAPCPMCIEGERALLVRDPDGHPVRLVGK